MAQLAVIVDSNVKRGEEFRQHLVNETLLDVAVVPTGEQLLSVAATSSGPRPDVVVFGLEEGSCDVIRNLKQLRKDIQILALVDIAHVDLALEAVEAGAANFLVMPFHHSQLVLAVLNAFSYRDMQLSAGHSYSGQWVGLDELHARSPALQATLFLARRLADAEAPLVLEGPAGSGREFLARAIHDSSARRDAPFQTFNALYVPSKSLGDALFGSRGREGALYRVGGGTLLIRHVESLPESIRKKLAATIMNQGKRSRFRGRVFLAAQEGSGPGRKARRDLQEFYSRINALPINIPYLKDMREDIPVFAELYCRHIGTLEGRPAQRLSIGAARLLMGRSWPGNLEELSRAVFQAVMVSQEVELQVGDFRHIQSPESAKLAYLGKTGSAIPSQGSGLLNCIDPSGNIRSLHDVEQEFIRYALDRYSGHVSEVARQLGIGRSTLYRKLSSNGEEE